MKHIVIVGSGPVGSFMATLCGQLGFQVTVYEKRKEFTRNINLKLESNFFSQVQEVLSRLNIKTDFFYDLNENLSRRRNRILIKELEEMLSKEAKLLGARYIKREVESFDEVFKTHKISNPIVLDCTGRNSKLRTSEFGSDEYNIVTVPLQHAMYINFKAIMVDNISLYQVMKHVKTIKLTEVIVGKIKDANGFSDITLPVFITKDLASVFDKVYPNINREPLNPFNSLNYVPDTILFPISSLIANLIVDGCKVELDSVEVKKIEITCGYAKRRSKDNYICLGDSAIHLAFFRSLNLGLKHAFELFIKLSMFHNESGVLCLREDEIINKFVAHYPHLNPIKVFPTVAMNVFLVVTKVIWYGCFSFCLTNYERERLTNYLGVHESQIFNILQELNTKLSTWKNSLADFEAKRNKDIQNEIDSNQTKSLIFDSLSWFIDINGKSFIKISEISRAVSGKYSLYAKDFQFFFRCFKARREALVTSNVLINIVKELLKQSDSAKLDSLRKICASQTHSTESKINLIFIAVDNESRKRIGFTSKVKQNPKLLINADFRSSFIFTLIRNELAQIKTTASCFPFSVPKRTLGNPDFEPIAGSSFM